MQLEAVVGTAVATMGPAAVMRVLPLRLPGTQEAAAAAAGAAGSGMNRTVLENNQMEKIILLQIVFPMFLCAQQ